MKQKSVNWKLVSQIRNAILKLCSENTRSMREIVDNLPQYKEHPGTREVKKLVYALANSMLLYNKGRNYRTTADGKRCLQQEPDRIE